MKFSSGNFLLLVRATAAQEVGEMRLLNVHE